MARLVSSPVGLVVWMLLALSCASPEPYPANQPLRGPQGSYELVPPTDAWVRVQRNESRRNIDLSLARTSSDAWLNVSVVRGRYATPGQALDRGRSRVESMMTIFSRDEQDASVPSPDGDLPGRLGVYCGSFDRELSSRDSCFVILATLYRRSAFMVVGQVRVTDSEPGRQDELTSLVRSLRITARERE